MKLASRNHAESAAVNAPINPTAGRRTQLLMWRQTSRRSVGESQIDAPTQPRRTQAISSPPEISGLPQEQATRAGNGRDAAGTCSVHLMSACVGMRSGVTPRVVRHAASTTSSAAPFTNFHERQQR